MTVFTDIFTGAPLQPSDVGYTSYTLTADKTLSWPSTSTTSDTVARIMTIVCNGAYSLTFPAANEVSTGQDTLITNTGSSTLTVKDSTGATITTVAAGAVKYIYLTDNATVAGVWAAVAFGVGTSNVDAAALAGYGLLAVSTTLNQSCPVTSISTALSVSASDRARLIVDTTGITITLPSAATIGNNFFTFIRNGSSGTTTIAPSGGDLIDNGASVALNPAESVMVVCSGTAWYTVGWGRSVTFNYTQLTKNVAGGTNVTLSAVEAGYKILKFTGLLTANINVVVPTTTTIWYVDNSTTGGYTLTVKTSAGSGVSTTNGTRYVLYGDGTNVVNAVTVTGSFSSFTAGSASAPSITFAADTDTGLYNTAANQVGVAVAGTQVANFTASGAAITGAISAGSASITGAISAGSASITGAISAGSAILTAPLPVTSGGTGTTTNPASAVANTPAGNIAATNVQTAINELDTEKAKSGANSDITSLTGLTTALSVGQGGTGAATLTANAVLLGNGTSAVQSVAPSTSGNVLTSNGTSWESAAPAGASSFPSGTRMPFNQTSAPTGWTKDTSFNDALMRVVSGAVGSGGSTAFSTFNGQTATSAYTLTIADIPAHTHTTIISPWGSTFGTGFSNNQGVGGSSPAQTSSSVGGGGAHSHGLTHAIKYNDFIIAVKD